MATTNALGIDTGSDTQVLAADSAEASGYKWAAAGGTTKYGTLFDRSAGTIY